MHSSTPDEPISPTRLSPLPEHLTGPLEKLMVCLEADLPVEDWMWGEVHLWPAVRIFLGNSLIWRVYAELTAWIDHGTEGGWTRGARRIESRFQAIAAGRPAGAAPMRMPDAMPPLCTDASVLFATEGGLHSLKLEPWCLEPTLDPWVALFSRLCRVLKVEIASPESDRTQPRQHSTLYLKPWTSAMVKALGGKEDLVAFIDGFHEVVRQVSDHIKHTYGPLLSDTLDSDAREFAYQLYLYRCTYDDALNALAPNIVIQQNYYIPRGCALNWAAARRGIPCVDVQHGFVGRHIYAYSHWSRLPLNGYDMLPSHFLVWNQISASQIDLWMPSGRKRHHPVVGGRPGAPSLAKDVRFAPHMQALEAIAARHDRVILVTLAAVGFGLPAFILEAMRRAPPGWFWLFRCHPLASPDSPASPDAITRSLLDAGMSAFDCHAPTAVPLLGLLPLVSHHVTQVSSTILESLAAGIPTLITHPIAFWFLEPSWLNQSGQHGFVHFTPTAEALLTTIAVEREQQALEPNCIIPVEDADCSPAAYALLHDALASSAG